MVGGLAGQVHQALVEFRKAKVTFIETVGNLLRKDDPLLLPKFLDDDLVALLTRPMLQDVTPTVQIAALDVVGLISDMTDAADSQFIEEVQLGAICTSLQHDMKAVQQAGCNTLSSIARKSHTNASAVISAGVLPHLLTQLGAVDGGDAKVATVQLINTLVVTSQETCDRIMSPPTLQDLVSLLRLAGSSEALKAAICTTLADSAAYHQDLALRIVAADALPTLASLLKNGLSATRVRSSVLLTLGQVAKHSEDMASQVMDQGVSLPALNALLDSNPGVRRNAALLIHEVAKKTGELCHRATADGGVACLAKSLQLEEGHANALPTVLTVGHMAEFSASLAHQAVLGGAAGAVVRYLGVEVGEPLRVAAAWALARLARHGEKTAGPLAQQSALPSLLKMYSGGKSEKCKERAKEALKEIVHNCHDLAALEPMVDKNTPPEILRHVLFEFETGLPSSVQSKRNFVTSGALMRMLNMNKTMALDSRSQESTRIISELFPEDVVTYYNAG